jgi:serine phosphatase RsbU (regulator of sigma subunit)/PAS domain-containing protein
LDLAMSQPPGLLEFGSEVAGLKARRAALEQAAALPGSELRSVLEAAFAELDGAIEVLALAQSRPAGQDGAAGSAALLAERRLLRAAFQDAPVPLFLLGRDGSVRRVNSSAATLLGSRPGYATGKLFTAFVDLPSRAAVHSQLAAVARTGKPRETGCSLLSGAGTVPTELTIGLVRLQGDSDQLIVVASQRRGGQDGGPGGGTRKGRGKNSRPSPDQADARAAGPSPDQADVRAAGPSPDQAVRAADTAREPAPAAGSARLVEAMAHRYDLATAATRLLLENATFSESVTLQRCARLLASELAAWVIVDVERRQRLRRQFVMGPVDQRSPELARVVSALDPQPGTAPMKVHESGSSLLIAHPEDAGILGVGPDDVPVMMLLGATSVLCVPLSDGERTYGVLTLARHASEGHFQLADLGLIEELGEQLALAIRLDRTFRRHSEIADALQASLLPRDLPEIPGVEIAAAYVTATEGMDVGGDFYDVYSCPGGWGLAIGDVCGKGDEAAAVTAAARHAIRVVSHWSADPAEVLEKANEIMLAGESGDRFVTAKNAHLQWRDRALHVVLGSAGHPGPVLVRPDGRVRIMPPGGLPLGIFPRAEPTTDEIDLHPGDVLFFFTDGVTEARSPEMTFFEDRLSEELSGLAGRPPRDIVSGMQSLVLEFCRNELRDDMTMLVMRVGEPPDR